MFIRKITPHGNSLTVAIPKPICRDLNLNRGDFVVGQIDAQRNIIIGKINPKVLSQNQDLNFLKITCL